MKVPWLSKASITDAASLLIDHYEAAVNTPVAPPIPVEDLIERGLNLRLGFHDLKSRLNLSDVLGATFVEKRLICVDASLVENKTKGRMFFTLAHEAGHWMLHRTYIRRSKTDETAHFCRVQDAKRPVEWQADYFASCLLMPEEFVRDAFQRVFDRKHLALHNVQAAYCGPLCFDPCIGTWPRIAAKVMEAGGFSNVSKQAMIIRLQDLGLIRNETRAFMRWDTSLTAAF
jgi:hypothetical protein